MEIVNMYKYLGIYFSTRLSFSHALNDMSQRAKNGVICIFKLLWSLGERSPSIFFKLFDTQIQSMLNYGSEVWGLDADHTPIERVHLFALKRFSKHKSTYPKSNGLRPDRTVPVICKYLCKCIKFWLRILKMTPCRLPFKVYKMLLQLHERNKRTWASSVCYVLYKYDFGDVWVNQGVGDEKAFLKEIKERVLSLYREEWDTSIRTKERFTFCSTFNIVLIPGTVPE